MLSLSQFLFVFLLSLNLQEVPGNPENNGMFFTLLHKGLSRLKNDVISESSVRSWLGCAISCLGIRFCAAYNFKEKSNKNEINCQLTHNAKHKFKRLSTEETDWTFYVVFGERMSEEENECVNGGKMIWDPEKPFKCECPKKYGGELCEKCLICPCDWLHIGDRCYYFSNKSSIWSEAQNDCRARGGDLAVPENSETNEKIYQVLKSRNIGRAWIGVYEDESDNLFTVSGVKVSYTNWYPSEPNNLPPNCVVMMNIVPWALRHGAALGRWDDNMCTFSNIYYVCELKAQP